jgi:hypothetical protein
VEQNLKAARGVRDAGGYRCGIYASSIRYDDAQLGRMEAAVQRLLPYVDEYYWLPLYGQAGLTSGAQGTVPTAGNQGRVGALRKPLPCWSLFTEGHITYDRLLLRQAGLSRRARRAGPHLEAAHGAALPGDEHDLRLRPARFSGQNRARGDRGHPKGEVRCEA